MKIIEYLKIRRYSNWIDIGCADIDGHYFLFQMRYHLKTNKKQFAKRRIGWVNSYIIKPIIFKNVISYNLN